VTGMAKITKVNGKVWVTISSNDEVFLKVLANEAEEHGFETELDLSWNPILKLRHDRVNVEYLKKALESRGLQVTIL